jgi:hypothetical protein
VRRGRRLQMGKQKIPRDERGVFVAVQGCFEGLESIVVRCDGQNRLQMEGRKSVAVGLIRCEAPRASR